uniref:Putative capsid protein n=1 Tax=viral metagenome TaxID=1070528 RepID=A0A6M3MGP6_9ZZZZ
MDELDPILAIFRSQLEATIVNHAATVYLKGSAKMVQFGRTLVTDKPIFFEGPPMQDAINYATKRGAQMVTRMDQETKERLAKVVGDAIKDKRGVDGLARDIRKEFIDMQKERAQLIAKSETRDALFHASQDRMEDLGVTGKEWILGSGGREGNCPDCQANAAAGVITIDAEFPTPQYEIHPGCTCGIAPVMIRR